MQHLLSSKSREDIHIYFKTFLAHDSLFSWPIMRNHFIKVFGAEFTKTYRIQILRILKNINRNHRKRMVSMQMQSAPSSLSFKAMPSDYIDGLLTLESYETLCSSLMHIHNNDSVISEIAPTDWGSDIATQSDWRSFEEIKNDDLYMTSGLFIVLSTLESVEDLNLILASINPRDLDWDVDAGQPLFGTYY